MKVSRVLPVLLAIGVSGVVSADVAAEKKSTLTISSALATPHVYAADRAAYLRQLSNSDVPVMTAEQTRDLATRKTVPAPVAVVSDAGSAPAPMDAAPK